MIELDPTVAVRDVYTAEYAGLVGELASRTADQGEAERSVQTAFITALENPRAFGLLDDQVGWLRDHADRAARTLRQSSGNLDFDAMVTKARRRQRRRTAVRVLLVVALFVIAMVLFLRVELQPYDNGLFK